ncbi:hypothetical protein EDB81DRAFT_772437 [Dactylonectria macrodidyma]|uniref:F-box domain-containing protein n=1 Tax=Dactylonectria macrodidyma TaxID=307937 RepID=A0A9P9FTT1_9HYPO|nr:hypothetical protein EDB81DRAFT_772437 [Dactylonectria macrodidyma]
MAEHQYTLEEVIELLSYQPETLIKTMIKIKGPPSPPSPLLFTVSWERLSSLGHLDRLPPELMYYVLDDLDFQSLANLARVSSRANTLVESCFKFQDILSRVPEVPIALRKLGLGDLHSVSELYATMRAQKCANCSQFGAFLFLPTNERCCWRCLRNDPNFRVIPHDQVRQYFGLSTGQLKELPTLKPISGTYGIWNDEVPDCSLVSVKAAKELAIKVHGSEDNLVQVMEESCKNAALVSTGRFFMGEEALRGKDLRPIPNPGHIPIDTFSGVASMPFPHLTRDQEFEDGLWCRGCEATNLKNDKGSVPHSVLNALVPRGRVASHALLGLERRARSRKAFLRHLRQCYGARQIIPSLGAIQSRPAAGTPYGHT